MTSFTLFQSLLLFQGASGENNLILLRRSIINPGYTRNIEIIDKIVRETNKGLV